MFTESNQCNTINTYHGVVKLTICIICDKGESSGGHDVKFPHTSKQTNPPHNYKPDLRPDRERDHRGFHDKYVSNKHRDEKL